MDACGTCVYCTRYLYHKYCTGTGSPVTALKRMRSWMRWTMMDDGRLVAQDHRKTISRCISRPTIMSPFHGCLRRMPHVVVLLLALCLRGVLANVSEEENVPLDQWQECDIFMAPSTTGWGVFAARDFAEGEHVDTSSLSVPTSDERHDGTVVASVLNDYVYGFNRYSNGEYSTIVLHGPSMFFNHHPEPNVQYSNVISGPVHALGWFATRAIQAGEQLFSTYGSEDGGVKWFADRKMTMVAPEESMISAESLPLFKKEFCSKIYAGFGRPFLESLRAKGELDESFRIDASRLAPFDAGIGDARARRPISKGERIEVASGLLLSTKLFAGTVLGSLLFSWHHLNEKNRANIRILRESGQIMVQYQDQGTDWVGVDNFVSYEDLSILPASGQIGMVRRVGETEASNCRLDIAWKLGQKDSVSVTLELIATQDIDTGDVLLLNLPPAGTKEELRLLKAELDGLGQPYFPGLFKGLVESEPSGAEL